MDLPGYGYARGARDGRAFDTLAHEYFFGGLEGAWMRPAIAGVVLLVDARHPGLDTDREACAWFAAQGCALQLVATKADKLSRAERQRAARGPRDRRSDRDALMTSVPSGEGMDELWTWIAQQVEQWKQPTSVDAGPARPGVPQEP